MSRFCTLRQLDFNHFYRFHFCLIAKQKRVEAAVFVSASEVAGPYWKYQISSRRDMLRANSPFSGGVSKTTFFRSPIERQYRPITQCSITHRSDIKNT